MFSWNIVLFLVLGSEAERGVIRRSGKHRCAHLQGQLPNHHTIKQAYAYSPDNAYRLIWIVRRLLNHPTIPVPAQGYECHKDPLIVDVCRAHDTIVVW